MSLRRSITRKLGAWMSPNESAEPPPQPRQLVLFFDGTGNSITGNNSDTNVLKLYQALLPVAATNDRMRLYYDPGVGSADQLPATGLFDQLGRTWRRLAGLAEGAGVFDNVAGGYAFLMRNHRRDDRIFIFGFSRGAFTARAVAGLVNAVGVMNEDSEQVLPLLTRVYFSASSDKAAARRWSRAIRWFRSLIATGRPTRERLLAQIKRDFTSADRQRAAIHFVGVWDTVDSVGLPGLSKTITSTPTVKDKPAYIHVRQALSLDEHRWTFEPRVYRDADYAEHGRTLLQRWFSGAHSDVGGGYADAGAGLSRESLSWMAGEARTCGLADGLALAFDVAGPAARRRHDELLESPWWALAGMTLRDGPPPGTTFTQPYVAPPPTRPRVPTFGIAVALVVAAVALWASMSALCGSGFWADGRGHDHWQAFADFWSLSARPVWLRAGFDADIAWYERTGFIAGAAWGTWQQLSRSEDFGWALICDLVVGVQAAYLLGIVGGRAFVRWAGPAKPGARPSAWRVFGAAPAWSIVAYVVKDVAWLVAIFATVLHAKTIAGMLFVVGVSALFVSAAALLGCVVLLSMGWTRRPRAWVDGDPALESVRHNPT